MKALWVALLAALLWVAPAQAAEELPAPGEVVGITLFGSVVGMAVGAPVGAIAWGSIAEPIILGDSCSGPDANDINCGLGPVVRSIFIGAPIGMGLGTAAGATLFNHWRFGPLWTRDLLGTTLATTALGTAAIFLAYFIESPAVLLSGIAINVVGVPVVATLAAAQLRKEVAAERSATLVPTPLRDGAGLALAGGF